MNTSTPFDLNTPDQPSLARVLYLEDNVIDAEMFGVELMREWPACEIRRVTTREDFVRALQEEQFDLILSDFTLPAFDGFSALALARERRQDIPFLFLSGTIGEHNAVEALKRGAVDYVL